MDDDKTTPVSATQQQLSSAILWLLALTCGMLIANVYFGQPLTGLISEELGMPKESTGLIVTLPLIGYGVGLLVLVPLGDLIENRRLILSLMGIEAASLLLIGMLSHPVPFLAAGLLVGLSASTVQMILPYASHLTPDDMRGKVLGRLVSGIMIGIMLARPISSFLASVTSWRAIYLISGIATALMVVVLRLSIPVRKPVVGPSYGSLLVSMGRLFIHTEPLRRRIIYQAAMFGAFSAFWTTVPLWLSGVPFDLTQKGIALVALAGAAGAIAPPFAGRMADKGWVRAGTALALLLATFSFLVSNLGWAGGAFGIAAVVAAAFLLDFAITASLVFGQKVIYALGTEERSRLNGLFMGSFFFGGAIASAISGWCFARFGWIGVSVMGVGLPLLALMYWMTEPRTKSTEPR